MIPSTVMTTTSSTSVTPRCRPSVELVPGKRIVGVDRSGDGHGNREAGYAVERGGNDGHVEVVFFQARNRGAVLDTIDAGGVKAVVIQHVIELGAVGLRRRAAPVTRARRCVRH